MPRRPHSFLIVAIIGFGLASCSIQPETPGERLEETDFGLVTTVDIGTNYPARYRMIVDTGAAMTVLNLGSGLPEEASFVQPVNVSGATNARSQAGIYRIDTLGVGEAEFDSLEFVAIDLSATPGPFQHEIDGILSPQSLQPGYVEIDFSRLRLIYHEGPNPDWGEPTPLNDVGLPLTEVVLAGYSMTVVIDSGATALLTLPLDMAESIPLIGEPVASGGIATVNDTSAILSARLDGDVVLEGVVFTEPEIDFTADIDAPLLGLAALRYFRVIIDTTRGRPWIVASRSN